MPASVSSFWIPQLALVVSALSGSTVTTIFLLLVVPMIVGRQWLLLNWLGLTLINFALYSPDAGSIGLLPTYYYAVVVALRLGFTAKTIGEFLRASWLEALGIAVVATSFVTVSLSQYFVATAIKSSLQIVFLLLLSAILRQLDRRWFVELREQARRVLPAYLVAYLAISIAVWPGGEDDRFGGMLGAQAGAFELVILFAFFWLEKQRAAACLCLFALALTGSRTYAGIAALVIFAPLLAQRIKGSSKLLAAIGFAAFVLVVASLLPYISERFIVNDEFYGTLLGRLVNYQIAIEHIRAAPIFGNGMGSILVVLENWVPDFFDYYRQSGDTTIMHDEYLRIAMEMGCVGCGVAAICVKRALSVASAEARTMVIIMLAASLTENTIAAYSTAALALILLARAAAAAEPGAPR